MPNASQIAEQVPQIHLLTRPVEEDLYANDPLLSAVGLYKDLWAEEHADEYIARLRKDW